MQAREADREEALEGATPAAALSVRTATMAGLSE